MRGEEGGGGLLGQEAAVAHQANLVWWGGIFVLYQRFQEIKTFIEKTLQQ